MDRILVVEDSPTQAERLRLILEGSGCVSEVAVDAEKALERLGSSSFDMVISDIVMPGLTGYELCRKIKAEPAWKHIPVILLTTRKDPMDIFRGLECGADNFYTKPYDADRLIERVRNILYNKQLRTKGRLRVGIEVALFGKTFTIGADKEQILDLLISTFEDIVQANLDLEKSRDELSAAKAKIEEYAHLLEGRIRTSEEMHRAIIEGISEGIITIDEQGDVNSINPAAEGIFGYAVREIIGRKASILMPALSPDSTDHQPIVGKGLRDFEGCRKDGANFPIHVNASEVVVGEKRLCIVSIRDLTEQRATEQKLRQAQKMEAIGQLAGGIAHDFNNLLTVVLVNLELVEEMPPADKRIRERLSTVAKAAQRGASLTHRLLAFSRQQVLEQKICDVGKLVSGMEEMLRRTLGESIEIETLVNGGPWLCRIDDTEFENALLNLAINSRDAMPTGGKLTIEIVEKRLDDDYAAQHSDVEPGNYVVVAVSDTGAGIPRDLLERVFEPFFTTKEKGKGTGLGLSMVYGFIKQSGGHANIYSEEGHGTTIRMYLPIIEDQGFVPLSDEQDRVDPLARDGVTVLIVDDNQDVRDVGVSILERLSCRVIQAENAGQALALLDNHDAVDLLFTDVVMPGGMNGIELAREAKRRRPNLKILFCSGYADAAAARGRDLGRGAIFVAKPYRMAELSRKLREALTRPE